MSQTTIHDPVRPQATKTIAPRPVRNWRAHIFQSYLIAAVAVFALLAYLAHDIKYFDLDLRVTLAIQSVQFAGFDFLMRFLSVPGFLPQAAIFTALIIAYLYLIGLKWEAAMSLIAAVGANVLSSGIKLLVARPRPAADLVRVFQELNEYSFPSGHVLFYVSFIGFVWFLVFTLLKSSWRRTLALWSFGLVIALIGVSRIYLGGHWTSDVLGAYLLGSLWLTATIALYRWGKPRFFATQPLAPEPPRPPTAST